KESCKNWISNNLEKNRKTKEEYKKNNLPKVKKWKRDWDVKNRDKYKVYRAKQPKEKIRLWQRKTDKKIRSKITDGYIIGILCAKNNLKASDIRKCPELIEIKRTLIKIHREIHA